jgi:hypothetical protein
MQLKPYENHQTIVYAFVVNTDNPLNELFPIVEFNLGVISGGE